MKEKASFAFLIFLGAAFVLLSIGVLVYSIGLANDSQSTYPKGSKWGNYDISGMTPAQAKDAVDLVYSSPVVVHWQDKVLNLNPIDFGLNIGEAPEVSLPETNAERLMNVLWGRSSEPVFSELIPKIDRSKVEAFVDSHFQDAMTAQQVKVVPIDGTTQFTVPDVNEYVNRDELVSAISSALVDLNNRDVDVTTKVAEGSKASTEDLKAFLQGIIRNSGFRGVIEIYFKPVDEEALSFAETQGKEVSAGIAFSAASTIKIPVMAAALNEYPDPVPQEADLWIRKMIGLSENPPADALMIDAFGSELAPLDVTKLMQQSMGMPNSFLLGLFKLGSPLLDTNMKTEANTRADYRFDLDAYNQSTPSDMGVLLNSIYHCARGETNPKILLPEGISQADCQYMIDRLAENKIGALAEAGVPDGTKVAHKHGWTEESDGYLHTISDTGIIFTPGGDYVYAIYAYQKSQLLFDPANALIAQIGQVLYNYMNNGNQIDWKWAPVFFPN